MCWFLQNIGPKGAPGMPEAGLIPIPKKLARARGEGHGADLRRAHVRHGRRARSCCTSRPESAGWRAFGARFRAGIAFKLDVPNAVVWNCWWMTRYWPRATPTLPDHHERGAQRGYRKLYLEEVLQAEDGVGFRASAVPRTLQFRGRMSVTPTINSGGGLKPALRLNNLGRGPC